MSSSLTAVVFYFEMASRLIFWRIIVGISDSTSFLDRSRRDTLHRRKRIICLWRSANGLFAWTREAITSNFCSRLTKKYEARGRANWSSRFIIAIVIVPQSSAVYGMVWYGMVWEASIPPSHAKGGGDSMTISSSSKLPSADRPGTAQHSTE